MAEEQQISPQLQKLLKVIREDNIITPDEIEQLLAGILTIIETFQAKSEEVTIGLESKLRTTLNEMAAQHNSVLQQLEDGRQMTQSNATEIMTGMVFQANKRIDRLIKEVKAMMPRNGIDGVDGKDADDEAIVQTVLERIKLPEYEELQPDTGEEIVDKVNDLPTDDEDKKIDAVHIKNLPRAVVNNFSGGGGGIKGITSNNFVVTDDSTYAGNKNISIPVQPTPPSNPFNGMLWIDNS